jgi:hypothetical protein
MRRHSASGNDASKATDRVRATAESKQKNAIAGTPQLDKRSVAVNDVAGDAEPGCLSNLIVDPAKDPTAEVPAIGLGAQPGIIESRLLPRINEGIRPAAGRAIELVDIATLLVETEPACLPGSIREDHDVLTHGDLRNSDGFPNVGA